jgi:hypothetical protein
MMTLLLLADGIGSDSESQDGSRKRKQWDCLAAGNIENSQLADDRQRGNQDDSGWRGPTI